ncbi:MAG: small multi-drug export protein, partial [candidate division WOR-3 bacterium]
MREAIIERLENLGVSPELAVFIIALLPVIELRGAVPVGINFYHLLWYKTVILALLGNLLPVPFLLLLLAKIAQV